MSFLDMGTACHGCKGRFCSKCASQGKISAYAESVAGNGRGGLMMEPKALCVSCSSEVKNRLHRELSARFTICPFCDDKTVEIRLADVNHRGICTVLGTASCQKCGRVFFKGEHTINCRTTHHIPAKTMSEWLYFEKAQAYEKVCNHEEAANNFELAGLPHLAIRSRMANRTHYVRQVTVDINQLLEFLRSSNYVIPYRCPTCGATLKFDAARDSSHFLKCEYCGSELMAADVDKLIRSLMS
jgi:uncharacterized protein with PIN domain